MYIITFSVCLGGACCRERRERTKAVQALPVCAAYNLRPRRHPGPNYYETRVRRRHWTSKRKPRAKPKPQTVRCPAILNEAGGDMEAARRSLPEPMDLDSGADEVEYPMSDAQCEDLANDRLVEAVENICSAFGIVNNGIDASPDGCGSSVAQIDSDVYRRMFPEYAHELSAGYPDYSIMDLTQGPDIYYRIPVIEGGVVTPSWEEARCVVKQEADDDAYVVPQDLANISGNGNVKNIDEMPVDSEDIRSGRNSSVEGNTNNGSEEDDWRNEAEEFCDTDSTPCDVQLPDVNNIGDTNEPEKHLQDDSDTDKPSDCDEFGMFFGDGARNNWPSPTVFPHEKQKD